MQSLEKTAEGASKWAQRVLVLGSPWPCKDFFTKRTRERVMSESSSVHEIITRVLGHKEPEYAYALRAHADYIEQLKSDCLYLARDLRHVMELNAANVDYHKEERAKLEGRIAELESQVVTLKLVNVELAK